MKAKDIYSIWAPEGSLWTEWVKPTAFLNIKGFYNFNTIIDFSLPSITYLKNDNHAPIIIDLPGYESVVHSIALAKLGYRPIPLFNGTLSQDNAMPLVENKTKELALIWGTSELLKLNISSTALPAFLLDSNRLFRHRYNPNVFDNSWDIYDQDLPSADYFIKQNIKEVIVVGKEFLSVDLARILYKFQKKHIPTNLTQGIKVPNRYFITKPEIMIESIKHH